MIEREDIKIPKVAPLAIPSKDKGSLNTKPMFFKLTNKGLIIKNKTPMAGHILFFFFADKNKYRPKNILKRIYAPKYELLPSVEPSFMSIAPELKQKTSIIKMLVKKEEVNNLLATFLSFLIKEATIKEKTDKAQIQTNGVKLPLQPKNELIGSIPNIELTTRDIIKRQRKTLKKENLTLNLLFQSPHNLNIAINKTIAKIAIILGELKMNMWCPP